MQLFYNNIIIDRPLANRQQTFKLKVEFAHTYFYTYYTAACRGKQTLYSQLALAQDSLKVRLCSMNRYGTP